MDAGGYSVDLLIPQQRIVVEVDGPSHFVSTRTGPSPSGSTMLKHRHLKACGYHVVSVPYFEWDQLTSNQRTKYLRKVLLL